MSSGFWKRFLPSAEKPKAVESKPASGPVTQVTKMAEAASQPTTVNAAETPLEELPMSILSKVAGVIETGISTSIKFITTVFSKTAEVDKILVGLAPQTKAALLATFYDVVKTGVSAEGVVQDASVGNFTGAVTLSSTTVTLVKDVWSDLKTDESVAKADLTALGAINAPATPAA
jgi:hypothetical protein